MENKDDEQTAQEEKLLADPQKALDHIIKSASPKSALHIAEVRVEGGSSGSSIDGQVAPGVGDPFDPKSWEAVEQQPVPQEAPSHASSDGEPRVAKEANPVVEDDGSKMEGKVFPDEAVRKEAPVERYNSKKEEPTGKKPPAVLDEKGDAETAVPDTPDLSRAEILAAGARKIEGEILARIGKLPSELSASLNVSVVETGVLISLTDKHLFGMFRNGSAEPELQLIELVEAIAHVLQTHPGGVVVRGHTDSKPFRNRKYDNWQLSTARAHMAQYMLVRGGLEETRIHRVEGLADREPRVPGNPDADENRRIDILLETAQ